MKLFTFYTPDVIPLRDRFLSTAPADYDIRCAHFGATDEQKQAGAGGGLPFWRAKTNHAIEIIELNWGSPVIVSDIDIQFFGSSRSLVESSLEHCDIVLQREHPGHGVNIGFFGMRCNQACLDFWSEVRQIIDRDGTWDQVVVNRLLYDGWPIRWARFPREIWAWSQGGSYSNILLHHANVGGVENKFLQMEMVADAVNRSPPKRIRRPLRLDH